MHHRLSALILTLLAGCASQPATSPTVARNLLFGPQPELNDLALQFERSDWPAVITGYRLNEITYYTDDTFDDQVVVDEFGGVYLRTSQSTRTGAFAR